MGSLSVFGRVYPPFLSGPFLLNRGDSRPVTMKYFFFCRVFSSFAPSSRALRVLFFVFFPSECAVSWVFCSFMLPMLPVPLSPTAPLATFSFPQRFGMACFPTTRASFFLSIQPFSSSILLPRPFGILLQRR